MSPGAMHATLKLCLGLVKDHHMNIFWSFKYFQYMENKFPKEETKKVALTVSAQLELMLALGLGMI